MKENRLSSWSGQIEGETHSERRLQSHLRICFVSHKAYPALSGVSTGHIGGAERQASLMACWMAARGHHVSFVTWDEGQPEGQEIDGVQVLKLCRQDAGLPGVRFFFPRWSSLQRALRRANADIYVQNCGGLETGQVALWCWLQKRKFIHLVVSNMFCDPRLPTMRDQRERRLYQLGLRNADCLVVQTRTQQEMLRHGFGYDAVLIPMPGDGVECEMTSAQRLQKLEKGRVLWLGRICEAKRPDRLPELAEACPELHFDVVGPGGDSSYARPIVERMQHLPNVTVHGRVTDEQLLSLYQETICLCCTSDMEGFPNTFLEAWSRGIPVVTTFDPDGVIAAHGLGAAVIDVPGLARALRSLLTSPQQWLSAADNARQYYTHTHSIEGTMPKFEQLFYATLHGARIDPAFQLQVTP